jgi:glutathione S-transferase
MKLHWSPRSPYVRKVMIVAHETGLLDRITCVRSVAVRHKLNPDIVKDSPVGRIPVLVLDDGVVLSGSYPICEYLDSLHDGRRMIPLDFPERWRELELHGIADGVLDTLVAWRGELIRPEIGQWEAFATTCAAKTEACLDWLEQRAQGFTSTDYGLGQITTGIALDYLDFRFPQLNWRVRCPELAHCHASFQRRLSSRETEVVDDE